MITTNIRPISNHNYSGNITTQSQHQITTGIMDTDTETDPIFRHSPAYGITEQDIQNWNEGAGIDLSSYVTHDFLSEQAYLTSETDPVFSASPAAGITTQDITNWNNGAGIDFSSYVTYEYLSAQSYLTSVTFPDYSNTYQSKGDYITPDVLAAQSYITPGVLASQAYLTTETDPVFSASPAGSITDVDIANWNAAAGTIDMGAYVTKAQLAAQSYVTSSDLAAQSYLTTETDPVFSASPAAGITSEDIENWNAGGAVDLSSYVTYDYLSAQSYVTSNTLDNYVKSQSAEDQQIKITYGFPLDEFNQKSIKLGIKSSNNNTNSSWLSMILNRQSSNSYWNQISIGAKDQSKESCIEIYPGWINVDGPEINISAPAGVKYKDKYNFSPIASYEYVGEQLAAYVTYDYLSAQSYVTSSSLAGMAYVTQNDIVFPDYQNTYQAKGNYLTSESDPVFSASPAAGITAQDIENWNAGGAVDLSSYVTYEYLSAQSYLTSVTFPDYSNTYQAKGDYITPTILNNQAYVTQNSIVFPDYSSTYQTKGDYITPTILSAQSYLTSVTFPDYSNTYQAKGTYITPAILNSASYVTSAALSNYGYVQIKLVTQSKYIDRQDNILYVITDAPPIS